jgi:hypothetical protein
MNHLVPNRNAIADFFRRSIPDQIHLVAIGLDSPIEGRDFGIDGESALDWATAQSASKKNVYFTVNRVRPGVHKKPNKSDMVGYRFAHVDIDPPKDGAPWDKQGALDRLNNSTIPPTCINWSGNGFQAFWRLTDEVTGEVLETINRGLVAAFNGDVGTHNADRLLRVPGTVNWPNKKKADAGRVPVLAETILPDQGLIWAPEKLTKAFPAPVERVAKQEKLTMEVGTISPLTTAHLNLSADDYLRCLIDKPAGVDRSQDTFKFCCEALRRGLTSDQAIAVLLTPTNPISAHCLAQADPRRAAVRAVENAMNEVDIGRRNSQRKQDRFIGEGSDEPPMTEIFTVEEMLERFVFIKDGSQVADKMRPRLILSLSDFKNATAASSEKLLVGNTFRVVRHAETWRTHPERSDVETVTFRAGAEVVTHSPDGRISLNTWQLLKRDDPPADWVVRLQPFVDHVTWLWGENAPQFLDWLAHIEQQPGVLPHYGWLHIAPNHGLGRNWIAGLLARVWTGYVATAFDLSSTLNSQFNGRLAGKILAVVDEINEGTGSRSHQTAQALKRLVTEETRPINPKYGRQHDEWNACRWLIFSNSETALPLEKGDRRFWVVRSDHYPQDAKHYADLYRLRDDPEFIAAVIEFLSARNISSFNPGAHPPMTTAKAELLNNTRGEAEAALDDVIKKWPVDIISSTDISTIIGDDQTPSGGQLGRMATRAGLIKVGRLNCGPNKPTAYAVRNHEKWQTADAASWRAEAERLTSQEKQSAFQSDNDDP